MADFIEPVERLADMFRRLEGVGKKSALRMAFSVVDLSDEAAKEFADAIISAKRDVKLCPRCQNLTTGDLCPICSSAKRDGTVVCVVEDPKALAAVERSGVFHGLYHVLHGEISPMKGIGPDRLKIKELLERLGKEPIEEIIVATNPTVEGEATAMYVSKLITPLGVKVTRIANGVPVGGDLEYADEVTLRRAIEGRRTI